VRNNCNFLSLLLAQRKKGLSYDLKHFTSAVSTSPPPFDVCKAYLNFTRYFLNTLERNILRRDVYLALAFPNYFPTVVFGHLLYSVFTLLKNIGGRRQGSSFYRRNWFQKIFSNNTWYQFQNFII